MKKYISGILVMLGTLLFTLLICEFVIRLFFPLSESKKYYIWPPDFQTQFEPLNGIMPGVSGTSTFKTNTDGFRSVNLEERHQKRFLAIGGSTTECTYLDQQETWTEILQKTLNDSLSGTWVGNAGLSGTTTRHHLKAMQHLPLEDLRIDAIIQLIGINDFSKRLAKDTLYISDYEDQAWLQKQILGETFRASNLIYEQDPFYKKTALWLLMRQVKLKLSLILSQQKVEQDKSGGIYATWRKHRQETPRIIDRLPNLENALAEYERNINKMIDLAEEKSIRLIFVNQPVMWESGLSENLDNLLWFGGLGDFQNIVGQPYYSVESLEKGMELYNQRLEEICQKRGVEFIDLASRMEKDTSVFYDDVHFNESGAEKVAQYIAAYLLQ